LDEPTSTLAESEVETLFRIIKKLKQKGITIVYISHRLEEIFKISDRVTILKDGVLVKTCKTSEITKEELINKMVGRTLSRTFPEKRKESVKDVIIHLENVTVEENISNINLDIMKGEVLGIGGLVGMGQIAILKAIFGSTTISSGYIEFQGKRIYKNSPSKSIKNGISYISSDRRGEMLFLNRSVKENISISSLHDFQNAGFLNSKNENYIVDSKINEFNIAVLNREQEVQFLSGGNQQKAILVRWLIHEPKVLLLDEPTQGIDVGTKVDIYRSLRNLANKGISVVVVFSDMIELLGMCDRIAVIYEGRLTKIFNEIEATEEKIIAAASDHYRE
ncbi:MAG: sugar ABC transporter ATP-binding protein, partial [Actinobacteria bacterium]|nr:sugar ABC transporter ATP-binding protein [Actinomycetota bacterium]